jgi:ATP-dependent helicase/nuclease subunit A
MADARSQLLARAAAERLRLLYVAMTRAETWLIVAAAGNLPASGDTWYQRVEAGMQAAGATEQALPGGPGLRLEHADWDGPRLDARGAHVAEPRPMPDMLKHPPPSALPAPAVLSPSDLGGAKALPGEGGLDEEAALARGRHVHLLLEHLPRAPSAMWPSLADRLLADVAEMDRNSAFDEAHRVLTTPALAPVFAGSTLAEVAVTAPLGPLRLHGIVDRLILSPDHVCAVDFKTNALVPADPDAVPDGLLRQMGAYAKALTQVYPDRRIETALLWTRTATLMPLPNDLVERALVGAPQLDAESTGS